VGGSAPPTAGGGAAAVALSQDDVAWLQGLSEEAVGAAAMYCLYCLFMAQAGKPTVKVRLGEQHQRRLTGERE
jgi:hypothetical protein